MTVGILGLGLIGGSLVKAFRERTDHNVLGCDANERVEGFARLSDMVHGELNENRRRLRTSDPGGLPGGQQGLAGGERPAHRKKHFGA